MEYYSRLNEELDLNTELQDPLLSSLVFLTKYYGKPYSGQALTSGLPLVDGKITPELLPRAALRGGLDAKLVKKDIVKIPDLLLPCILALNDGRYCVLLAKTSEKADVAWPELHDSHDDVALSDLQELYTGFAFFVRKRYHFDERSKQTLSKQEGHWFWSTLNLSRPIYRDALIAAFFINLFAIASPLFVMNVYDRVVPNHATDTLWVLTAGMLVVMVFDFILKSLRAQLLDTAAKKSDVLLSARLFEKVLRINMAGRPKSVGAFARNIQEFDSIREFITSATMAAFVDVPFATMFILVITLIAGPLAIVPVGSIVVMMAYSYWVKGRIRAQVEKSSRFSAEKNAHLIEALSGIEALKLSNAESQFQKKWEEVVGNMAKGNMHIRRLSTSVSNVTGFIQQLSTVLLLVIGVYLIMEGNISMGALIAAVMLTGRAMGPFSHIAILATRYNQTESALKGLDEVMALPEESLDQYLHRPELAGQISFRQVSFAYPSSKYKVLRDISFDIKPKEKVAIIGRIGAGKTTIEKLLVGFYDTTEGAIRLDGIDINQISPVDIRQQVGCVPQDITLFYGSIRDNITLGAPHVDEERILRAARLAGVNAFTDIDPDGLDRQVGERGAFLSGGQRQAIVLARALLFNPRILVLDEPTSNMDNQSEHQIKKSLSEICGDKTLLLITHKLSMLSIVDRVIVLDAGQVVADGERDTVIDALREGLVRSPR
ncbi:MAG: type I secretion system permease/ATPase [Alteromonadaceae bacterium]|nr:MAG: type I secretion system permease/ATPase [Alteromonadaceae bacterium]